MTEQMIRCDRCGTTAEMRTTGGSWLLPKDWVGAITIKEPREGEPTVTEAVCRGCQYVEWHPHCTSLLDKDDQRVDTESMPEEKCVGAATWCDYVDLTVSWIDDADMPRQWTCVLCGGSTFDGVHRDYPRSGLHPGSFTVTGFEPVDSEED